MPKSSSSLLKRRLAIADIVRQQGEIKVDDLSLQMGVSGVTIRSDLNYLEQQGYLKRSFGGAIYLAQSESLPVVEEPRRKIAINQAQELELARQCVRLVKDHDTLFVGHGALMRKTIPFLAAHKCLRLITNDLEHAWIADDFIDGEVMVAGGVFTRAHGALSGELVTNVLKQANISCSIVVVDAIDADGNLCLLDAALADSYRELIAHSERCVAVIAQPPGHEMQRYEIGVLSEISALIAPQYVIAQYHTQLMAVGLHNHYTNNECLTYINSRLMHDKETR